MKPINPRGIRLTLLLINIFIVSAIQLNSQTSSDSNELAIAEYKTLPILIEGNNDNNAAHLTKESVQTRVELRLRSAGLKPVAASSTPIPARTLYVNVNIVGAGFDVDVKFYRYAFWIVAGDKSGSGMVSTWDTGTTGTHGNNETFILGVVERQMDIFLNAYLKANQDDK